MSTSFEFDHAYLRETVAAPLTEAMAQLAVLQPEDPVEFLGNFLLKYVDTELHKHEIAKQNQQNAGKPVVHSLYSSMSTTNNNSVDGGAAQLLEHMLTLERTLQDKLPTATTVPQLFEIFLTWLAAALDAQEAYMGRKVADPATGAALVHWIASSRGAASVTVDAFLSDANETITFDVFKEVAANADEDASAPATDADGGAVSPPAVPTFLHVENVLREPRLKFFHVPKLGALLTRGLQFKSFLHADVFNDANVEEPHIKDDWLVVSADTMGQARAFTALEIDAFTRSSSQFSHALETLERKLYMADAARKTTGGEDAQLKEFSIAFAAQVSVQEENLMLQVQALPEDDKSLQEAQLRAQSLTLLLVSHTPTIALAATRVVPFKLPVLVVCAVALQLLGHTKSELLNPATKLPCWEKIAPLLSESSLKPRLESFALPASAAVVAQAKQTLGDVSKSDAEGASAIAGCLFRWTHAVFAHAEQMDAAAERARVAAEEAAAAAAGAAEEEE